MPTSLAASICFVLVVYLFWQDRSKSEGVSNAIWIPLIWMLFAGSRFPSQWLNLSQPEVSAAGYTDGSPLDRSVFLVLILAGTWVLLQRRLEWSRLFIHNAWIWLFFLFCAMAILWADDPIVSFKRWIKGTGNLVVALIIATERRPEEALAYVLRRLAFLLLPLSVLFIKYYPELGRGYHMGMPLFSGATYGKNALGQLCLITGIYFCWELILRHANTAPLQRRLHFSVYLIMLPMTAWLLRMADSATSLACMMMALCLLLAVRLPLLVTKPTRIFSLGIGGFLLFALLENLFELKQEIIVLLGRRPDLTDRDAIWELVLSMQSNPLIGAGYESFWTGERLIEIWRRLGVEILQAHNGYIEIYLNLGFVGLALLVGGITVGLGRLRKGLAEEYEYSVLRITLVITVLVYNYTEATFVPVNNVFMLLLLSILDVRNARRT